MTVEQALHSVFLPGLQYFLERFGADFFKRVGLPPIKVRESRQLAGVVRILLDNKEALTDSIDLDGLAKRRDYLNQLTSADYVKDASCRRKLFGVLAPDFNHPRPIILDRGELLKRCRKKCERFYNARCRPISDPERRSAETGEMAFALFGLHFVPPHFEQGTLDEDNRGFEFVLFMHILDYLYANRSILEPAADRGGFQGLERQALENSGRHYGFCEEAVSIMPDLGLRLLGRKPRFLAKERFGIDLGGSYASIGRHNPDTGEVDIASLASANGEKRMPLAVFVQPDRVVVGNAAINLGWIDPARLFKYFKRELGSRSSPWWMLDGKERNPTELLAEILRQLKKDASLPFQSEVRDVVITFPAWFLPEQKDLTRKAAEEAGLNVIAMIEEPVAVALAYLLDGALEKARTNRQSKRDLASFLCRALDDSSGRDRGVLVYDLGGSTFDVALVQVWKVLTPDANVELHSEVLFNEGDIALGGKDWDDRLVRLVIDLDLVNNKHDPLDDRGAAMFLNEIEDRKKDLSETEKVTILCPSLHHIEVTREMLKARTSDLLDMTRRVVLHSLEMAEAEGIRKDDLTLLLSGGMCRWPPVTDMLTELMGRAPLVHKNVDFMVTCGAAYLSALITEVELHITPVTPHHPRICPLPPPVPPPNPQLDKYRYPAIGVEVTARGAAATQRSGIRVVVPVDSICGDFYEEKYILDGPVEEVEVRLYFLKCPHAEADCQARSPSWEAYKTFNMTLEPKPAEQAIHVRLRYRQGGVIDGMAWDRFGDMIDIGGMLPDDSGPSETPGLVFL